MPEHQARPPSGSGAGDPVVVGVDGSAESVQAAVLGARLADAFGAPLLLVGASWVPLIEVAAARLRVDPGTYRDTLVMETRERLADALSAVIDPADLEAGLRVCSGRPETVLSDVSAEEGACLCVLGGHLHHAPAWFDRGTARRLLRTTPVPVLVCGPGSDDIGRVVVAVDDSPATPATVRFARWVASCLGVPVLAVHVLVPLPHGLERVLDATGVEAVDADRRHRIETGVWPLLAEGDDRRIVRGEAVSAIAREAADGPASLLVVGSHGAGRVTRWLLGSTAEELLAALPCSIAVVPASDPEDMDAASAGAPAG